MTPTPNVVLATTDQQRADTAALEGFALDTTPFPVECQSASRAVTRAAEWVAATDGPFFLWLSIPEPHNP